MICSNCGTENRQGRRFCAECGSSLSVACPSCGAVNEASDKFCGECGSALAAEASLPRAAQGSPPGTSESPRPAPAAERRLVSVLFADLVGFTTLSEHRDPEETRELLSRYFESSRRLIGRYGGTVEKFIGDAVMAVWGTPVAKEDDAERAARAALELVDVVAALGDEVGAADLRARVGVLTGEAAVTLGAEAQGMVAGDLVNTASRIQSVAEPGTVLVGEATRRASDAAIAYEDAGIHELKGKQEPVPLWRAVRVVGGRGGALRSAGLETPFVGREREMRLVKELFHGSADERKAHLVSVVGVAGVGKTRLSLEFERYIDGLADDVWWHRGRCLAYGEGVAYWALAEMVRSRAGIVEGEEAGASSRKLRTMVEEHLPEADERRWVEPRLAHLLGLEERTAPDQTDLFSAWRLFFERVAERGPVEMVFEDLQWADNALLDFIEYLLDWSKDHPIFILTLARPELMDRRPTWGAGKRNFTSLSLEPLPPDAMEELLRGLVPGLPPELAGRVLDRAEGIPLYAVETVRMLLDRGMLTRRDGGFEATGPVEELEVPESLQGLIAARLDGLPPEERGLLHDAAVLGKTFTQAALVALTGRSDGQLEPVLTSLVRKDFLSVQADPRSPERGQYGFLQDLVKRVAYDTLPRKERRTRHLAVAGYLESSGDYEEEEIVEVVAAHYLEAHRALPEAPDAAEVKARARDYLVRAGDHAAGLAANEEAQRYYDGAAELAEDPVERAELLERAALTARTAGHTDVALTRFEEAKSLFEAQGATHPAARVTARMGEALWDRGRMADALESMDRSFRVLSDEEPDEDLADLAAQLGRFLFFAGQTDAGLERIEVALEAAESLGLPEILSHALNTKSIILDSLQRHGEALALIRYALEVALENDIPQAALRAYYNLADLQGNWDRNQEAADCVEQGLALARRIGNRFWEWQLLGQIYPYYALGQWDRAVAMMAELPREKVLEARGAFIQVNALLPRIHLLRGDPEAAVELRDIFPEAGSSDDVQERAAYVLGTALMARAGGNSQEALDAALAVLDLRPNLSIATESVKEAFLEAIEAAFDLGDLKRVEELMAVVETEPPGRRPQYLQAHVLRFGARLAQAREDPSVEPGFKAAAGLFRELVIPFWLAVTLLEHGEWLSQAGRRDEALPLLEEARGVFEGLGARPWLERLDAVVPATTEGAR